LNGQRSPAVVTAMFKTILVHADLSAHAPARIRRAAVLAREQGGRLLGAAMLGVSRSIFPEGYDIAPGTLAAGYYDPLFENARRALAQFEDIAHRFHVPAVSRLVCDRADDGLAQLARFADLVVLGQDDPLEAMPDLAVHLQEYVILNGARPVLVVPRTDMSDRSGKVLVAWNGGKEASAALAASLPLLARAAGVTVVALTGPDGSAADFDVQMRELAAYLEQHGIAARMLVRAPRRDNGHDLLAIAGELDCGLLVMGCYGRSRFRELCLGGASRTVLAEATIPVLLAH
jgi:nucleotide-binding universal stress UspA family protein